MGKHWKNDKHLLICQINLCDYGYVLVCLGCRKRILQGALNNRNLFCHSSGAWKSKIKVLLGLVSRVTSLPGLQMATFLL